MPRLCAFIVCVFTPLTLACGNESQLAITHVTVIDVEAKSDVTARMTDQTVWVTGNRIARVGPSTDIELPATVEVVDGTGLYLVPGFQDMHVHIAWAGDDTARIVLPLLFANGVTGIRDMGSDNPPPRKTLGELRRLSLAIEHGEVLGPRIRGLSRLVNHRANANQLARETFHPTTREEGRLAVRNAKLRDVDFVKVYSQLSREAFFGLMEEANRLELRVAGHLPFAVTPVEASNAGMWSIEHARFPAYACGPGYEAWRASTINPDTRAKSSQVHREHLRRLVSEFDEKACREILAVFAKNGTWLCPTHTTRKMDASADDPEYRSDPRRKYIGLERLAAWDRDLDNTAHAPQPIKTHYKEFFRLSLRVTGLAHQAGVPIIVGTDCYDTHVFPGFSYHDELEYLREAGLSPLDILKAATIRAAECLKIDEEFGSIARGRRADMILLSGDPLSDIRNTARIHAVIFDGKVHHRKELQGMIDGVESYVAGLRKDQRPHLQLWDAVISNNLEALRTALKQGADVNALDTRLRVAGGNGRRALNHAALGNHPEMIKALLDAGADINLANRSGFTPLMHAAERGSTEAATILIKSGANLSAKSQRGQTALEIAEFLKHEDTAAIIRKAISAKIDRDSN